jgi:hypothetical protein
MYMILVTYIYIIYTRSTCKTRNNRRAKELVEELVEELVLLLEKLLPPPGEGVSEASLPVADGRAECLPASVDTGYGTVDMLAGRRLTLAS